MTGEEERDLGFLRWKDPRAWMEIMKGERWKALVAAEGERFSAAVVAAAGGPERMVEAVEAATAAFEAAAQEAEAQTGWLVEAGASRIWVTPQNGGTLRWHWSGTSASQAAMPTPLAGNLDILSKGVVLLTEDIGKGAESYQLIAMRKGMPKPIWKARASLGGFHPTFCLAPGHRIVYVLESDSPLQYKRVVAIDVATGARKGVLYEEPNPSVYLTLIRGEGGCVFLMREIAGRQQLHVIEDGAVSPPLCPDGVCFHPVGYIEEGGELRQPWQPCYFVRRRSLDSKWEARGEGLKGWRLPRRFGGMGIDLVIGQHGILVTREHGERSVYRCTEEVGAAAAPKLLVRFLGEVRVNPWQLARGAVKLQRGGEGGGEGKAEKLEVVVEMPGIPPTRAALRLRPAGGGLPLEIGLPLSLHSAPPLKGWAKSADGTSVRWVLCLPPAKAAKVQGLIVYGYGAYGLSTRMATSRWKPFLERGIAVAFALVRGGGDHTEAWAQAGRLAGKEKGVEDLEACVRALREELGGLPAERVCLAGRSAGGYLVGATVARNPEGGLAGSAYTEVPYVDVLRTSSNPALPLTALEYLEFGDPLHRPEDVDMLLRLSPVDALGAEGAPGVFVLCRTAENDMQVLPYEAMKWADALRGRRGRGEPKLVAMTRGQGHFVQGPITYRERAEDYLLLCQKILGNN